MKRGPRLPVTHSPERNPPLPDRDHRPGLRHLLRRVRVMLHIRVHTDALRNRPAARLRRIHHVSLLRKQIKDVGRFQQRAARDRRIAINARNCPRLVRRVCVDRTLRRRAAVVVVVLRKHRPYGVRAGPVALQSRRCWRQH